MSDHVTKDLERALREAPSDAAVRLRLAAELGRSGRRGEALTVLDFVQIGLLHFAEAKALSEKLWREEVASFEPEYRFERDPYTPHPTIDTTGRIAVRMLAGRIEVHDLVRAQKLWSWERRLQAAIGCRGVVLVQVVGSPVVRRILVDPTRDDGPPALGEHSLPAGEVLVSAPARPDKLLCLRGNRFVLRAFPSLEILSEESSGGPYTHVLWGTNRIFFDRAREPFRSVLAEEIVATFTPTHLALEHERLAWRATIEIPNPNGLLLSGDGRTLRVWNRTDLAVHDLDQATGAVTTTSPRTWRGRNGWHPHAQIAMIGAGGSDFGRFIQDDARTTTILELENGYDLIRWEADGRALLARAPDGSIELWRARTSRAS